MFLSVWFTHLCNWIPAQEFPTAHSPVLSSADGPERIPTGFGLEAAGGPEGRREGVPEFEGNQRHDVLPFPAGCPPNRGLMSSWASAYVGQ